MVDTVKSADTDVGRQFLSAVDRVLKDKASQCVVFDCKGVNLSRLGSLELVSICFPTMEVYLLDFRDQPCHEIVKSVRNLFQSDEVTKIIHDCCMDCDALFHLHGITVVNVHDTSCFHEVITGTENKNLNDVLGYNGVRLNTK